MDKVKYKERDRYKVKDKDKDKDKDKYVMYINQNTQTICTRSGIDIYACIDES